MKKNNFAAFAFLALALLVLGWRVRTTLYQAANAEPHRVLIEANAALPEPPPLTADDRADLNARLEAVNALWADARRNPRDPRPWLALAGAALDAGDFLSARAAGQQALKIDPNVNAVTEDALGHAALSLGLPDAAMTTYRNLIARFPTEASGYIGLARAQQKRGQTPEATRTLERGVAALNSTDIAGQVAIAQQFEDFGDLNRALDVASAARERRPAEDLPDATLATTHLLIQLQRTDDARPMLESLVERAPNNIPARHQLAVALDGPNASPADRARAEQLLLENLRRAPGEAPSVRRLAEMYYEQRRFREAAAASIRVLELQPNRAEARLQLAYAYRQMGDDARAAEQQRLAAQLLERQQTLAPLTQRRDANPRDVAVRIELARRYAEYGRLTDALAELQSAVALAPQSAGARSEMAALYRKIGVAEPEMPK